MQNSFVAVLKNGMQSNDFHAMCIDVNESYSVWRISTLNILANLNFLISS